MCDLLKIPFFKLKKIINKNIDIEKLYDSLNYDDFNKSFSKNYNNFKSFLLKCGVKISSPKNICKIESELQPSFQTRLPENIFDDILSNIEINLAKNLKDNIKEKLSFFAFKNKKLSPILQKNKHRIYVN